MTTDSIANHSTGGRELLADFLRDRNITRFALRAGIDPSHIRRILSGSRTRISVNIAARIEDATKGVVPMRSWCTSDDEAES